MSQLFSPASLGKLTLENRIVVAPMCQYSAQWGFPSDWHMIHLGNLALSGASLLIIEATAVEPQGRISGKDLGIWDDEHGQALRPIIDAIRRYSPVKLGIQLGHAGRKASSALPWDGGGEITAEQGGWQTVAPSALPFGDRHPPQALSVARIGEIKSAFVAAAKRAVDSGFELIEIHAAHGYLLHQFLSPLSNQRDDEYGGSLENRMRLVIEILSEIRAALSKEIAVGVRISATDWVNGGWDTEQSIVLAKQLEILGCDYIHVSSGGLSPDQHIPISPNYQVPLAQKVREAVKTPVMAVGLITEPEQAEAIVATGQADFIALARGILYDPRWPWHAAAKLGATIKVAPQYLRCEPHNQRGLFK
ncbi:NADH:flavin oxidoreductase/NADH oxidase [Yersinia hibernica]|uniref:NADH:flavin oxidoreductase/NADH oxidase n=1 Tax=Yersinia enterocolitica LC20 TaxID=1443113 RepID=A0A7U4K256_YEREN|nr:NADH:flavin oxidoreductase/NADH oxidase [Yersinia hibernica]AHM75062.1 NADH:flavin oxidoreductase/NADH oxidase [Yersinia hibernica]OVZ90838.1 oxidoreductase [Yersinia kristensenii]